MDCILYFLTKEILKRQEKNLKLKNFFDTENPEGKKSLRQNINHSPIEQCPYPPTLGLLCRAGGGRLHN